MHRTAFPNLSKHPAYRFVNQIMLMCEHSLSDVDREFPISLLYLVKRSENDDAINPEV